MNFHVCGEPSPVNWGSVELARDETSVPALLKHALLEAAF